MLLVLTLAATLAVALADDCDLDNTDMWFGDMYNFMAEDFMDCKNRCFEEPDCDSVVYKKSGGDAKKCYIKNSGHWGTGFGLDCRAAFKSCILTEHLSSDGVTYNCLSGYYFAYAQGTMCCQANIDANLQDLTDSSTSCYNGQSWECPYPPCLSTLVFDDDGSDADAWRDDGRCGPDYLNAAGTDGECNPVDPDGYTCCSPWGWCGLTADHCDCDTCIDYSDVCIEQDSDGSEYRGTVNTDANGNSCQKWTSQSPNSHDRTPENYPESGLGDHNYCRNPDGESGAWCYNSGSTNPRWDYCDVPTCQDEEEEAEEVVDTTYWIQFL